MKPKFVRLLSWCDAHPVRTIFLSFLFFAGMPFAITVTKLNDDLYAWIAALVVTCVVGTAWFLALWSYSKKLITLVLAAAMIATPIQRSVAEVRYVGIAVGVAVLCGVGYCVYRIGSFCQRKFPKNPDTNAPPQEFSAIGEGEYGGAVEYSAAGSCLQPSEFSASSYGDTHNTTTFTLNVIVEPLGATVSMSADSKESATQSWQEFQAEMISHGLFLMGRPSSPQYEIDGAPCESWMVPLEFDPLTGRVTHHTGEDLRRVTVERSINLQDWSPLLVTDTGIGSAFKVVDTTRESQMFYRVQVSQP